MRVLDVNVNRVRLEQLPVVGRVLADLHEVGKVERTPELAGIDRLHHVQATPADVSVDALLVFVNHRHGVIDDVRHLLAEPADHFVANRIERPLAFAAGRVIAEHPDERRFKVLGDLDGLLEPVEVLGPRLVDRDLTDRRTDRNHAQPVVGELGLDLTPLVGGEVHDVLAEHAAQFKVRDTVGTANANLIVKVRADFVGKAASWSMAEW